MTVTDESLSDLRVRLATEFPWLVTSPTARRLADIVLALAGNSECLDYDVLAEACRTVAVAMGLPEAPRARAN